LTATKPANSFVSPSASMIQSCDILALALTLAGRCLLY
jgi:hypothetical protein